MQREFLKERTRCRALEEELENPMNVHRWRKLEASDPSTFEMIQKIHTLQKRLISKTEEVVEKELLLQVALRFLHPANKPLPQSRLLQGSVLRLSGSPALHAPCLPVGGNSDSHLENKRGLINCSFLLRSLIFQEFWKIKFKGRLTAIG
ncbi:Hypothetical predicted protein [Marmota monax]|nr:Hypothetical predicted protein [Marmota monax]